MKTSKREFSEAFQADDQDKHAQAHDSGEKSSLPLMRKSLGDANAISETFQSESGQKQRGQIVSKVAAASGASESLSRHDQPNRIESLLSDDTPLSIPLGPTLKTLISALTSLAEAACSLELEAGGLLKRRATLRTVSVQAKTDLLAKLSKITQLRRTVSQSMLEILGTDSSTITILQAQPALISGLATDDERLGKLSNTVEDILNEQYDPGATSHYTPTRENSGCLEPSQQGPVMTPDDDDADDLEDLDVSARNHLLDTLVTLSSHIDGMRMGAASLRNLYPSLLPAGCLPLPYGRMLTPEYRIVHSDGSIGHADIFTFRAISDSGDFPEFKPPPPHDSIYHPDCYLIDLGMSKCQICFDKVTRANCSYFGCECVYCNACLNGALRSGLKIRACYPPRCLCKEEIDTTYLQPVLDKDVVDLKNGVPEEWTASDPTYCAGERCGKFISGQQFLAGKRQGLHFGDCMDCGEMTCSKCKQAKVNHNDLCGKCPRRQIASELYALIRAKQLSRCPRCKILVELVDGCEDVSCYCGTEFCYHCGKSYDCEEPSCKCTVDDKALKFGEVDPCSWSEDAGGLDAELMVDGWPQHEKVIGSDPKDVNIGCLHLQAMAAAGQSRCHGCLQLAESLKRCFNCQLELCIACRPQMPNLDMEL